MRAQAFWMIAPRCAEIRWEYLGSEGPLVETLFSGVSRGTEKLVFEGRVPETEWERMRAPSQGGNFPFPVKYGYAAVGRLDSGELVFALHPHQDRFRASKAMLLPVPSDVPADRAILAANMETALNIVWDAGVGPGERVAIIGAGVVGALVGWLCASLPGTEVHLVDINPGRRTLAEALGCGFALPEDAPTNCDRVIHSSATSAGLIRALDCAGLEATVIEASWYGNQTMEVALGGAFHSSRLRLISSQVGWVSADRRARWSHSRRLSKALSLLADPVFDVLISGETAFSELPEQYGAILDAKDTLCHRIRYR